MTSRVLVYNRSACSDKEISSSLYATKDNIITFDNKYFTVSVEMCFETRPPVEEILDTVEAFLFVVDEPVEDSGVNSVLNCISVFQDFLNDANPEIKLLLLNSEQSAYETYFLEWCIEHEFEFVKLKSPDSTESEGTNGLLGESEGFARVLGALECHMWPYRLMKEHISEKDPTFSMVTSALTDIQSMMEGDEIEGDFETMFANMNKIKDVAGQLPDEERKKFAENVALSFWRAMGGSDDEIEGVGNL